MSRYVTLVQSRTGSSRMPGKALRPLCGHEMIWHVMRRAAVLGYPTVLVTTDQERDDALALFAKNHGYPCYRGSERDVLGRMADAATAFEADVIVRVTGDCPLWAPDVAQLVIRLYQQTGYGIVTNDTNASGWADGLDVEVFSRELLEMANYHAKVPDDTGDRRQADSAWREREHVTPWMRQASRHAILRAEEDWSHIKLSVDLPEDFDRVAEVMSRLRALTRSPAADTFWEATRAALQDLGRAPLQPRRTA